MNSDATDDPAAHIEDDVATTASRDDGLMSNTAALLAGRLTVAVMGWAGTV